MSPHRKPTSVLCVRAGTSVVVAGASAVVVAAELVIVVSVEDGVAAATVVPEPPSGCGVAAGVLSGNCADAERPATSMGTA